MNSSSNFDARRTTTLVAAAITTILLAACASVPVAPSGAAAARTRLTQLQSNPDLSARAPAAIKEAETAVRLAETPQRDAELAKHNVYMADKKVGVAVALARTGLAETQRAAISQQRDNARLDARTREADAATSRLAAAKVALVEQERVTAANMNAAVLARNDAEQARVAAELARKETEAARMSAAQEAETARLAGVEAAQQAAELQRQIEELRARPTDRGLVLTLGDVLFASGQADLKAGATTNLDKLVAFLSRYPNRTVMIEGYTDSLGSDDLNLGLSQRRADSVKAYIAGHGIGAARLTSVGKGEADPVAGNDSAAGRQQNRRVEVIISNQLVSLQ
ncbi:MAG: OmpA family protein [Steroidobacteraceae bacterium]